MALNDFADRELDAVERPERPLPSGRVSPAMALGLAAGLSVTGVALAGLSGGTPALRIAGCLAGCVYAYDLVLKDTPAGPLAMAAARGLDVALGAPGDGRALRPAATMAAHTAVVTVLSRGEVHGTRPAVAAAACLATAAIALTAATPVGAGTQVPPAAVLLSGGYAVAVAGAQARAARRPDGPAVRQATAAAIRGMILLQAALLARAGRPGQAGALLALGPVLRRAGRLVSPT